MLWLAIAALDEKANLLYIIYHGLQYDVVFPVCHI
jgi:hypothetical protein